MVKCGDDFPTFIVLDYFPVMYLVGSNNGIVCLINPTNGLLTQSGQIANGYPISNTLVANNGA